MKRAPKHDAPQSFYKVRLAELAQIRGAVAATEVDRIAAAEGLPKDKAAEQAEQRRLSSAELTGLALSGGGIRAATFSLGVLQALSEKRKLKAFDYLSTVSGGGYIGSFLSAWIHRHNGRIDEVEDALAGRGLDAGEHEAKEVTWLRQYSNYLAPKLGMLSADSMTLVTTWMRNVFLNLVVLVSLFAVILLTVRLLVEPAWIGITSDGYWLDIAAGVAGLLVFPLVLVWHLVFHQQPVGTKPYPPSAGPAVVLPTLLIPAMLAATCASLSLFSPYSKFIERVAGFAGAAGIEIGIVFVAWIALMLLRKRQTRLHGAPRSSRPAAGQGPAATLKFGNVVVSALAGIVGFAVSAAVLAALIDFVKLGNVVPVRETAHILTFGPPALLVAFGISGSVFVGIVGRAYFERSREWWSRLNAWFITVGLVWLALFWLTFYAQPFVDFAVANSNTWFKALAGTGWLGSLLVSLLIPKPGAPKTFVAVLGAKLLDLAATVVVVGFMVGVAYGTTASLQATLPDVRSAVDSAECRQAAAPGARLALEDALGRSFCDQERFRAHRLWDGRTPLLPTAFGLVLLVFVIFGWRVDVNKFSLHNMYKNRLIRCYLGASQVKGRKPQPFTGFDESDDVDLASLSAQRPLHLVNTTLNLTQGSNLAWQQRKAASFTFSPLFCGFSLAPNAGDAQQISTPRAASHRTEGYRPTRAYASVGDERQQVSLGAAVATSGAAVSPNMGQASTAARAFVLTLFNLRIGRWSANPMQDGYRSAGPDFGVAWLIQELFGFSDEKSKYVYLSDGGHFDNTGVYELVRRRCTTIVAVDTGGDFDRSYGDLAELVRKCRVDLGADIHIDLSRLGVSREASPDTPGFHEGTITYRKLDPDSAPLVGRLVVIKPTRLPLDQLGADLYSYARKQEEFPQQSTADQFFDESQFESYRALGHDITAAWLSTLADSTTDALPRPRTSSRRRV